MYELIYKIDRSKNHLRLIGENFFKRNKKLGHFIYNNRKISLIDKIEIKNIKEENEFKIHLILYKKIYNKTNLFKDCTSLIKFSFAHRENKGHKKYYSQIINDHEEDESLLEYYNNNEISENNLYQTFNEIYTFSDYSSINKKDEEFSNVSTVSSFYKKIANTIHNYSNNSFILSGMFFNCLSLVSLPDISEWNINNVSDINFMFSNCSSLISLPDISKWNTINVNNMNSMFG